MKRTANPSLNTILTAVTAAIVVLIIVVSNILVYRYMSALIRRNSVQSYEQVFNQANAQLQTALQDIVRMSAALSTDAELIGAVNLALNATELSDRVHNEKYAQYLLKTAVGYHPYIDNVGIYVADRQILMNDLQSAGYRDTIPAEEWFTQLLRGERDQALVSGFPLQRSFKLTELGPYYKEYCIYAMPFNDSLISRVSGVLLVSIDQAYIESFLSQTDYSDGRIIALLDEQGAPIYISDEGSAPLLSDPDFLAAGAVTDRTIRIGGDDYFLVRRENDMSGWSMVALIPGSAMYRDVAELQRLLVQAGVLTGAVGLLLCAVVSKQVTAPFKALMASMDRAGEGKLDLIHRRFGIREINLLLDRYDHMLERIDNLIRQVKATQQAKVEAELAALQNQINPHFTYNTLSSIHWVARMQGATAAAEMVSQFSRLLKLPTGSAGAFVSAEEEIEQIACYVDIMKFRYNSEITVDFDIALDVKERRTLKLILQPIVENCFVHGFRNLGTTGHIVVRAFLREGDLLFVVEDDGVGMAPVEGGLPETSGDASAQLHRGIGVRNVHERIQPWFGAG